MSPFRAFVALLALAAPAAAAERVSFPGADGFEIVATLHAPAGPTPSAGAGAAVLLPMVGASRASYDALGAALAARGVFALAIDLRGHGESARRSGAERRFKSFEPADWAGIPRDAIAALRWLRARPGVDPARTALVGAGIGANAALVAAEEDVRVRAVALLSPGLDDHGLRALPAVAGTKATLLLVSGGDEDERSREAVRTLAAAARGGAAAPEAIALPGGGHGTEILERKPASVDRIAGFLTTHLSIGKELKNSTERAQDG